jgi:hypothetical protein
MVIGDTTVTPRVNRVSIIQPYLESCTTGIYLTSKASDVRIYDIASTSSTTTLILNDSPGSTHEGNILKDSVTELWGPPTTALITSGWSLDGAYSSVLPLPEGRSGGYQAHMVKQGSSPANGPQFQGVSYNGVIGAVTATANLDNLVTLAGYGYESVTPTIAFGGRIHLAATEAWTDTAHGTEWIVSIVPPTTTTESVEAVFAHKASTMTFGLGYWNTAPPTTQPTTATDVTVGDAGSTTAVYRSTTFPGASGSTKYTIGDIVTALKAYGMIAA